MFSRDNWKIYNCFEFYSLFRAFGRFVALVAVVVAISSKQVVLYLLLVLCRWIILHLHFGGGGDGTATSQQKGGLHTAKCFPVLMLICMNDFCCCFNHWLYTGQMRAKRLYEGRGFVNMWLIRQTYKPTHGYIPEHIIVMLGDFI